MIVYVITNNKNDKKYFGATRASLNKRWHQHKSNANKRNGRLYAAMKEIGIENFKIEMIQSFSNEEEMYNKERSLILEYNTNNLDFGYNNSTGGKASLKGVVFSEQTLHRMSLAKKGIKKKNPHSELTKQKMRNAALGRDMSKAVEVSAKNRKGKPAKNVRPVVLNNEQEFNSITAAAAAFNISISSISNNISGLSKKTKVGIWTYKKQN